MELTSKNYDLFQTLYHCQGYNDGLNPIKFEDYFANIYDLLPLTETNFPRIKTNFISVGQITKESLDQLFDIHPVYKTIKTSSKIGIKKDDELGVANKKIARAVKLASPYEIPILLVDDEKVGFLSQQAFLIDNQSLIKYFPYSYICINKNFGNVGIFAYAHEIMHTQLESKPGYTTNYHNSELIPILAEGILCSQIPEYQKEYNYLKELRLGALRSYIRVLYNNCRKGKEYDLKSLQSYSTYLVSTVQALHLLKIYEENLGREESSNMIHLIQQIMDGELTVEQLLDHYDVTLENSFSRKLLKTYK
jgi:hypothetical protein